MKVAMKNPKTGEIKEVKVGFSFILFFFSGWFGIPLFLRKLHVWGGIFLALWITQAILEALAEEIFAVFLMIVMIGLAIFLGVKGNEMTAKNYLENDWEFVEPDSEITRMAKAKWGINN